MTIDRQTYKDFLGKTLITLLILGIVSFLTPEFRLDSFWILLVCVGLIGFMNFFVQNFTSLNTRAIKRGLAGFLISFMVLGLTGKIMAGFNISIISAIIASLLIGTIDIIIPGKEI